VTDAEIIDMLNARRPAFLKLLRGEVSALDRDAESCTMSFDVSTDFCHSVDVIQGGFVTSMLDAAMTHTAFALSENLANVATLEIKVSFLEPSRAGRFSAVGTMLKVGRSTGFMSGKLYNEAGELTATATTTAKLIRAR
jgi:uncharacterized protein (TIGR00369 family)